MKYWEKQWYEKYRLAGTVYLGSRVVANEDSKKYKREKPYVCKNYYHESVSR